MLEQGVDMCVRSAYLLWQGKGVVSEVSSPASQVTESLV